jgi:hypothetical protein
MTFLRRKLPTVLSAFALTSALMAFGAVTASAAPNLTCIGGTVPGGVYRSLTIAGFCTADGGSITVQRNLVLNAGSTLIAAYSGSNVNVGRDLLVRSGADLILGCAPGSDITCFGDAEFSSSDSVGNNLVGTGALAVIVHHTTIWGEVAQTGGGGAGSCDAMFVDGPPPFTTYEGSWIGHGLTVAGLNTCWDGINDTHVGGTVNWNSNKTTIPDGNLVGHNTIGGNLNCFNNKPAPHLSDFPPFAPNVVGGVARGQCASLV